MCIFHANMATSDVGGRGFAYPYLAQGRSSERNKIFEYTVQMIQSRKYQIKHSTGIISIFLKIRFWDVFQTSKVNAKKNWRKRNGNRLHIIKWDFLHSFSTFLKFVICMRFNRDIKSLISFIIFS